MLRRRLEKRKQNPQEPTKAKMKQTQEELNRERQELYEIQEQSQIIREQNLTLDKQTKQIILQYYEEVYVVLQPYFCNLQQRRKNLEMRQHNVIQLQDCVQHALLVQQYQLQQHQQLQKIHHLLLKEQKSMKITHSVTGLLLVFAIQAANVLLKANILQAYEITGSSSGGGDGRTSLTPSGTDAMEHLTQEELDEIQRQSQLIRQQNLELREHTMEIYLQLNEHISTVLHPYIHNLQQRLNNLKLRHEDMVQLQYRIRQALIQQHEVEQKQQLQTSRQVLVKEHKVMEELYKRIERLLAIVTQAGEALLEDNVLLPHETN
ncbi:hypothetical protein INT45_008117 [Circinella minor]|uniref:Uncharacterized protein n=1 Tax=Circinella minor TaxID=1195481 RepID=A0A8H7RYQ7_9FUNG|nr:hypothetical protein INT45_008117 [Circinella minor]